MPSKEDIERLSQQLHEDESSQDDEKLQGMIEQLRTKNDEIVEQHDAGVRAPLEVRVKDLESQLTTEREKMKKLKQAISSRCKRVGGCLHLTIGSDSCCCDTNSCD